MTLWLKADMPPPMAAFPLLPPHPLVCCAVPIPMPSPPPGRVDQDGFHEWDPKTVARYVHGAAGTIKPSLVRSGWLGRAMRPG